MSTRIKIVCVVLFATGCMLLLGGCNTLEGVGHDIAATGDALSSVAKDTNPGK